MACNSALSIDYDRTVKSFVFHDATCPIKFLTSGCDGFDLNGTFLFTVVSHFGEVKTVDTHVFSRA